MRTNLFGDKYCYCFYTVKWFQVFQTLIILFNINHLVVDSEVVTSIAMYH